MPPLFQGEPETLVEAHLQDLQHFRHVRRNERSLSDADRDAFEQAIQALEARAGSFGAAEFQLELARLQARIDNGHSNATATRIVASFDRFPVRSAWMDGELRILRVLEGQEEYLGARITRIGGVPAREALWRFRDAFGGNDAIFQSFAPVLVETPAYLEAVGLADPVYRLELMSGEVVEHRFEAIAPIEGHGRIFSGDLPMSWRVEGEGWVAFEPAQTLLYLQRPDNDYWYVELPEQDAAYIAIRSNFDDASGESLSAFVERARAELAEIAPRTILVDQRFNGGGDLTITLPLMEVLGDITGDEGAVYMLTSGSTFSAGIVNLAAAKEATPEQVQLEGEPIGDRLQFWAEGWWYSLPNSGFRARYSTGFYDLQNGCEGIFICPWGSLHHFPIIVDDLDVDIDAPMTFEAYAAGRDPALAAIGLQ